MLDLGQHLRLPVEVGCAEPPVRNAANIGEVVCKIGEDRNEDGGAEPTAAPHASRLGLSRRADGIRSETSCTRAPLHSADGSSSSTRATRGSTDLQAGGGQPPMMMKLVRNRQGRERRLFAPRIGHRPSLFTSTQESCMTSAAGSSSSILLKAEDGENAWILIELQGTIESRNGLSLDGVEFASQP